MVSLTYIYSWIRSMYINNLYAKLVVDTVALVALLAVSDTLARLASLGFGLMGLRLRLLRTVISAGILLVHEYIKEGYLYNTGDLNRYTLIPPSTHEAFILYAAAVSLIAPLLLASPRETITGKPFGQPLTGEKKEEKKGVRGIPCGSWGDGNG